MNSVSLLIKGHVKSIMKLPSAQPTSPFGSGRPKCT